MKCLNATAHGVLDYLTVLLFLAAPRLVGFEGRQATFCYLLAVAHLLLTLITRFPLGVLKTVPFLAHGAVELAVSLLLVMLPWLAGFSAGVLSRNFYVAMGLTIFLVWLMTDYQRAAV